MISVLCDTFTEYIRTWGLPNFTYFSSSQVKTGCCVDKCLLMCAAVAANFLCRSVYTVGTSWWSSFCCGATCE